MYFYFYDKFTQDPKYEVVLTNVETKLIDLGINGRIEKLSIFKNARELIEDGIKKGAHTVVAVGDDKTFANVVNIVAPFDVTLGFIPIVEGSRFAEVLGMPVGEEACLTLSRRLYEAVDLGQVDDMYFLGSLTLPPHKNLQMKCDDMYSVATTAETNEVRIVNLGEIVGVDEIRLGAGTDGRIDLMISPVVENGLFRRGKKQGDYKESVFPAEKIAIDAGAENLALSADGAFTVTTPCDVVAAPGALKVIVGRERLLKS
ncbi:diacylglycerol kinase family protein [Patescibacteria group bacterium]